MGVWHPAIAEQARVELRVRLSAQTLGSVAQRRQRARSLRKQLREGQRALFLRAIEGSLVSPTAASLCALPSSFSHVQCGEFEPDVSSPFAICFSSATARQKRVRSG